MGNWTREVKLDPIEFDGDTIVFTAKRLLAEDMGIILQNYDADTGKLRFNSHAELAKVSADIFPKYVTNIDGMTKSDGTLFTLSEFIDAAKEFYFVPLVGGLFSNLMAASTVGKSEKKFVPPLPDVSGE